MLTKENAGRTKRRLEMILADTPTIPDFKHFTEKLVGYFDRSEKALTSKVERIITTVNTLASTTRDDVEGITREFENRLNSLFDQHAGRSRELERDLTNKVTQKLYEVDTRMSTVRDGADGMSVNPTDVMEAVLTMLPKPKESEPETPEEVVEKVNESEVKIKLEQIEGLEEYLKKHATRIMGVPYSGGSGGNTVRVYDLSASLNGVLKTFSLPAFWRVLTVDLSSFPNALRPTVDFTSDAALMTITFTSQIDAATSLAAGQTCIVTYATTS